MKATSLLIILALTVGSCSGNAPTPAPTRTIAYFAAHKTERDSVIAACKSAQNTTAAQSEECGTAMVADQQVAREAYMQQRLGKSAER